MACGLPCNSPIPCHAMPSQCQVPVPLPSLKCKALALVMTDGVGAGAALGTQLCTLGD
ncbi:uncharacterized protein LY79DRAFT_551424 [Colletotrichum navitas]|uniref:Uncharacterized protein n=1 Tax=Colletotrichum navitas TaxID=681940 RepID=A0AAD8Q1K4_9PEZI|nr:uncharacterized protein LY79DRAFT_551424 [Colletotrichum navitas]KAK1593622.1 hypothetical protein LY79DRAFT_551424 [Colletotrichum navitas]